jgi:hypothetical protein
MSDEPFSTKRIIALRKLTRAVAGHLTALLREYLEAIGPQLRPRAVLGDYVEGVREQVRGGEAAFKDVQTLYEKVGGPRKFDFARELEKPIELGNSALEITPVEYSHIARVGKETKTVLITAPLRWTLTYEGFSTKQFEKLRGDTTRTSGREIFDFYLHYIVLSIVANHQPRLMRLLDTLHFPVSSGTRSDLGELPLTFISSKISTLRPPDEVIIENTEISGVNVFEEVVNVEDLLKLRDPLQLKLLELAQTHGMAPAAAEAAG